MSEGKILSEATALAAEPDEIPLSGSEESILNGDEELDPRIADSLERLNAASDRINGLERELSLVRADFHKTHAESIKELTALKNSLKKPLERVRPYYEAKREAYRAKIANQRATKRYEKATSMHKGSIEMVAVAERDFVPSRGANDPMDTTWVELLNHANEKFVETEKEKNLAEYEHLQSTEVCERLTEKVVLLEKKHKSAIKKSSPFFKEQVKYYELLEKQKQQFHELQKKLLAMKADYSDAMATLERISEEIHQKRQLNRQLRERKLQRDITVSVGDCEDLDDVDGMVRDLAVGLDVDLMGSLDSLQSEISTLEVFNGEEGVSSSNDVSSSEQSSKGMNAEIDALGVELQSTGNSMDNVAEHNEAEMRASTNELEVERLELSREEEQLEKQEKRHQQEETVRQLETDNRHEELDKKQNKTVSEIVEGESLDVGKEIAQNEHRIANPEMDSQENDLSARQEREETKNTEENRGMERQDEKEAERDKQTERQAGNVNENFERVEQEQATEQTEMKSMSREQTEEYENEDTTRDTGT